MKWYNVSQNNSLVIFLVELDILKCQVLEFVIWQNTFWARALTVCNLFVPNIVIVSCACGHLDTFHPCISNVMPLKGLNDAVTFIIKHRKYWIVSPQTFSINVIQMLAETFAFVVQNKWFTVKSLNQGLGYKPGTNLASLIKASPPLEGQRWWSCMVVVVVVVGGFCNNIHCQHRMQLVHLCPGKPTSPFLSHFGHLLSESPTKTPDSGTMRWQCDTTTQHIKVPVMTRLKWHTSGTKVKLTSELQPDEDVHCRWTGGKIK